MKNLLRVVKTIAYSVVALVMAFVITVGGSILGCSVIVKTTSYDVSMDGLSVPSRVVVVADLHGKEYGLENKQLIKKVRVQQPDAIILLGDLFPSAPNEEDLTYVLPLTEKLQDIAQVSFAMGNHEREYTKQYGGEWIESVKNSGAIVLDEEWAAQWGTATISADLWRPMKRRRSIRCYLPSKKVLIRRSYLRICQRPCV